MKRHTMRLKPAPFEKVRSGKKTIEIRVNDEKRRQLSVGDEIQFSLADVPEQTILVQIVGLDVFKTFEELFHAYSPALYGGENQDEWPMMYLYYPKEEEEAYGVLAIRFTLEA